MRVGVVATVLQQGSEIAARVRELTAIIHKPRPFFPGVTPIPYSGRVFGEEEVASLVSSSLDFWRFTFSRYTPASNTTATTWSRTLKWLTS